MKWLRASLVALALLAMPAVAVAGHIEPVGSGAPVQLVGTDHYGKVKLIVVYDKGVPKLDNIVYATACHLKGVSVPGTFKGTKAGTFAGASAKYAVSGVITSSGTTVTARGSITAAASCKGSTAPLTFSAKSAS
ncbi:MAG TPA: hypothetical protein VHU61_04155 [Solirubrobacteraceae bacterium]|nr:hypothetical protein [Solirubrobacteraceae bacterium]